jgi:hypothetical protein
MHDDFNALIRAFDRLIAAQQKGTWDYVQIIIVLLTLGVLMWYTIETYRLRKVAQDQTTETAKLLREARRQNEVSDNLLREAQLQNEVSVMPILAVAIEPVPGGDSVRVVLRNVGSGPAFNLLIDRIDWDGRRLQIEPGSNVLRRGQANGLMFHFMEGGSGNLLDAHSLGLWLRASRMPNPISIKVRCNSVNTKPYLFVFSCTSDAGKLRITYEGSTSGNGIAPQQAAPGIEASSNA